MSAAEELEAGGAPTNFDAMVKDMVRLALSSEYARVPIRRADISNKVLGERGSKQFKVVFEQAQRELKRRFGMEMVELPAREKLTITQRRAAQKTEKPSTSSKSWVLSTTLPQAYRIPSILSPAKAPSSKAESTYTALYSFAIAVISLNGGSLAEQKLERYLARMNVDTQTPLGKTDKFLQRVCKEGYLVRTREVDGGEEIIEYTVGPRGKVEVGSGSVAGLVREVYGFGQEIGDSDLEDDGEGGIRPTQVEQSVKKDFEMRLRRTLGMQPLRDRRAADANGVDAGAGAGADENEGRRRSSRRPAAQSESDESD
ncbi:hypothetical protein N7478_013288 [Penicillium angulare]|uniref:uncharacterized protein n=1 Tax=Penicillium angulare TaxID=116970 RepID=UPI002540C674|nr:uncharacterized protein N7478_013288 [Penicillium angulare]KAJ5257184.1 hypothetical protein N7478_013288 [Penicillium angulare]